ncbi:hypothetical protein FNV43_RR27307 [Rhamnella rubrinervis]|uniref:Uncharacterized protein n=1 Tax=Rhamnella rubrinervis TaxID=2594499 RepID=A0A8K0GKH1_9ROSA|nr:hypothetical protein FNV43_RR27307 [Rhamnella rubrinervis]
MPVIVSKVFRIKGPSSRHGSVPSRKPSNLCPPIAGRNWDFHTKKLLESKHMGNIKLNCTIGREDRRRESDLLYDDEDCAEIVVDDTIDAYNCFDTKILLRLILGSSGTTHYLTILGRNWEKILEQHFGPPNYLAQFLVHMINSWTERLTTLRQEDPSMRVCISVSGFELTSHHSLADPKLQEMQFIVMMFEVQMFIERCKSKSKFGPSRGDAEAPVDVETVAMTSEFLHSLILGLSMFAYVHEHQSAAIVGEGTTFLDTFDFLHEARDGILFILPSCYCCY